MLTFYKHIKKEYLDLLECRKKLYDGRVLWKDWIHIQIGDTLILTDEERRSLAFRVSDLVYANDFVELYSICGDELMPNSNPELVRKTYAELYGQHNIDEHKVVGILLLQI